MTTDPKIIALLNSGTSFLLEIDPDGVLERARPSQIRADITRRHWRLEMVTANGDAVQVAGEKDGQGLLIRSVQMPPLQGEVTEIPVKPARTFLEAVGRISEVPVRLRRCMAPKRAENAPVPRVPHERMLALALDALFYGVEGAEEAGDRKEFRFFNIKYVPGTYAGGTSVAAVEMGVRMPGRNSMITVETNADPYGIGGKHVWLDKRLGLGRRADIDCYTEKERHRVPSLLVARDLDRLIPPIYEMERKKDHTRTEEAKQKLRRN